MTLSVKKIAKLTARGRYFDAHGLYLQVISPTNRSWLLRFELNGRKRWMGLGSAATFTLAEARERALAARKLLADKIDPLDARRTERAQLAAAAAKSPPGSPGAGTEGCGETLPLTALMTLI